MQSTEFFNPDEVSEILRVNKTYLSRMRRAGDGPIFVKFGGVVIYKKSDIEEFINKKTFKSTWDIRN